MVNYEFILIVNFSIFDLKTNYFNSKINESTLPFLFSKSSWKQPFKLKGSFKRYVTLFLAKICPSLPPPLVTVRNVSNMSLPLLRNEIFEPPLLLLIENKGNNLRYISKRYFNTQLM